MPNGYEQLSREERKSEVYKLLNDFLTESGIKKVMLARQYSTESLDLTENDIKRLHGEAQLVKFEKQLYNALKTNSRLTRISGFEPEGEELLGLIKKNKEIQVRGEQHREAISEKKSTAKESFLENQRLSYLKKRIDRIDTCLTEYIGGDKKSSTVLPIAEKMKEIIKQVGSKSEEYDGALTTIRRLNKEIQPMFFARGTLYSKINALYKEIDSSSTYTYLEQELSSNIGMSKK